MPDVQIVSSKVAAGHSDYTVPESASFVLKAVYAEFTDNGAAVDWLPTVIIVSDSNHTVTEASDQGVKVTAGSDAEVSWFPGVKHAAAAAAAGTAPDYLLLTGTGQTVVRPPIGDSDHAKFVYATRQTNDDASWTYILDGAGDVKEVDTTVPGRYQSICQFVWGDPVASSRLTVVANTFGTGFYGVSPAAKLTTLDVWNDMVEAVDWLSTGTGQLTVEPAVQAGDASISFDAVYWWILRWRS